MSWYYLKYFYYYSYLYNQEKVSSRNIYYSGRYRARAVPSIYYSIPGGGPGPNICGGPQHFTFSLCLSSPELIQNIVLNVRMFRFSRLLRQKALFLAFWQERCSVLKFCWSSHLYEKILKLYIASACLWLKVLSVYLYCGQNIRI